MRIYSCEISITLNPCCMEDVFSRITYSNVLPAWRYYSRKWMKQFKECNVCRLFHTYSMKWLLSFWILILKYTELKDNNSLWKLYDAININSLRPSHAYMRHWTVSSLIHVLACRLFGDRHYLKNDDSLSFGTISVFLSKIKHFHWRICIWKHRLPKCRSSCSGLNLLNQPMLLCSNNNI